VSRHFSAKSAESLHVLAASSITYSYVIPKA